MQKALTDLRLRETEGCCELGALRECQVLRPLEPPVELLKLEARVDGARLAHLLSLAVHPQRFFQLRFICNRGRRNSCFPFLICPSFEKGRKRGGGSVNKLS